MEFIKIPTPDFSFDDYIKKEARKLIDNYLLESSVATLSKGYDDNKKVVTNAIQNKVWEYNNNEEKLTFISEILLHLSYLKTIERFIYKRLSNIGNHTATKHRDDDYYDEVTSLQFFTYNLAASFGYNFDKNTFSSEDVVDINSSLNEILIRLDTIAAGQEVIFNEFEDIRIKIKSDFVALKSDIPLGKKRFFKIALGTIGSYVGNKIADEIFTQLHPYILALLKTQAPHLLETVNKFIG